MTTKTDETPGSWHRLLRVWTVAVARMPGAGWPAGRWRSIGLTCAAIVFGVVVAGVIAGGIIGVGAVELARTLFATDPLVAQERP